jgi:four helix bundle protein
MGRKRRTNRDIEERTLRFAVSVVRLAQVLESGHGVSSVIGKQILRAGTSIGANLHEAKGSQSRADFISKCSIACKEAHETLYWLDLLIASNLME